MRQIWLAFAGLTLAAGVAFMGIERPTPHAISCAKPPLPLLRPTPHCSPEVSVRR
jgi:hypothetical protein